MAKPSNLPTSADIKSIENKLVENKTHVQSLVTNLKTKLNDKGVDTGTSNSLSELVPMVGDIVTELTVDPDMKTLWERSEGSLELYCIRTDQYDNVYVAAGNSVYKYSSDGNRLWEKNISSRALVVAVDKSLIVYATGSGGTVYKINAKGDEIWNKTNNTDWIRSMAINSSGDLFVGSDDKTVKKISSIGDVVWTYTSSNYIRTLKCDKYGSIYAGGDSKLLVKLNSNGAVVWEYNQSYAINDIDIDEYDTVYSINSTGRVIKTANNLASWEYASGAIGGTGSSIAVDKDGSIYVGFNQSTNNLRKLDTNGNLIYTKTAHTDGFLDININDDHFYDSHTNGAFVKRRLPQIGSVYTHEDKVSTIKEIDYVFEGRESNELVYEWVYSQSDYIRGLDIDDNYIYPGGDDRTLAKLTKKGNVVWKITSYYNNYIYAVEADSSGNVYISPTKQLEKYDSSGNKIWAVQLTSNINDISTDKATGSIYCALGDGTLSSVNPSNGRVIWNTAPGVALMNGVDVCDRGYIYCGGSVGNIYKLNYANAERIWSCKNSANTIGRVVVDNNGDVIAVDSTNYVIKQSQNGGEAIWKVQLPSAAGWGLAVDKLNNIYTIGSTRIIVKISPNGDILYSFTTLHSSNCLRLCVDNEGIIYTASNDKRVFRWRPTSTIRKVGIIK